MNKNIKTKIAFALLIISLIAVYKIFNLGQYITLAYIKESNESFTRIYRENFLLTVSAYMLFYILITALSLPGAAVLTLAGGALFGFWVGLIVVSFASTIGATLACFVSRFFLRDWVESKFSDKFAAFTEGFKKEGAFYLFSLRLVPIFPFFVINLLMGLTKISLSTFYLVSQIGMLPGTIVYINAGRELGKIDSLSGIASPALIISFAILGLFPITVKKILSFYKSKYR